MWAGEGDERGLTLICCGKIITPLFLVHPRLPIGSNPFEPCEAFYGLLRGFKGFLR